MPLNLPGNVCVIGLQWGDEGKGKIVHWMTEPKGPFGGFDLVVRFGGGANAGHTVVVGDQKFAMHLIPSGILWPGVTAVIANGVVFDPETALKEIDELQARGVRIDGNLKISTKAHLVMPYHKLEDRLSEERLGKGSIGTTCRGIGPCYADKATRSYGIRIAEMYDQARFDERLQQIVDAKNRTFKALYGRDALDWKQIRDEYRRYADRLAPYICETTEFLHRALRDNKRMLFEGAQGSLLDLDHGTYPFVTSSNCTLGGLFAGTGLPPKALNTSLGIIKAYTTRVGAGPFPSELTNDTGQQIRDRGGEYGTTTGRPRRTGWFDAVVGRYSADVNGTDVLGVMKLDVLTGLDTLRIAVAYRHNGRRIDFFPTDVHVLKDVEVEYEEMPGWQEDLRPIRRQQDLPKPAVNYLRRLQELMDRPISIVSVGAEKTETIALTL